MAINARDPASRWFFKKEWSLNDLPPAEDYAAFGKELQEGSKTTSTFAPVTPETAVHSRPPRAYPPLRPASQVPVR